MFLLTYKNRPEDVECRYCTQFCICKHQTRTCPWLQERLDAGVVSYAELMLSLLDAPGCPIDCRRMAELLASFPGNMWCNQDHQTNYHWLESNVPLGRADTNRQLAAAYLLSATPRLVRFVKACYITNPLNHLPDVLAASLSAPEITLLMAATALLSSSQSQSLDDLLSDNHADLFSTRCIAHTLLIAKHGSGIMSITE